jgi:hypothetical protein
MQTMPEIWETAKGLPPRLWLPTAEEDTEHYRAEHMARTDLPYYQVENYGRFVVALISWDIQVNESDRVSTMPKKQDFNDLRELGFGMSSRHLQRRHDGVIKLQKALNYMPDGYTPSMGVLEDRFKWILNYAYFRDMESDPHVLALDQLVRWGAERDYTPGYNKFYIIMDGDSSSIRRLRNVEKFRKPVDYKKLELYRLGAQILEDHGEPLSEDNLHSQYDHRYKGSLRQAIVDNFGSFTNYWLEFDKVPTSSGLSKNTLINLGVRWRVANPDDTLSKPKIEDLSKQKLLFSPRPLTRFFGGVINYRNQVEDKYEEYKAVCEELEQDGVDHLLLVAIGLRYGATDNFIRTVRHHASMLKELSKSAGDYIFISGLIMDGFDLLHDEVFDMQLQGLNRILDELGANKKARRFIFALIPRIDPDEVLAL